jgi:hypothetical protein
MWLEAPHADSDEGTLLQSATNLVALGARAMLVTGANRCADAAPSPCSGTTTVCGKRGLRVSDAAHYPNTFFTAAHRALRATYPDGVTVSIHGMEGPSGGEAAIVTDGTDVDHPGGLSVRLRNALNQHLTGKRRAYSCNAPADQGDHRPLCGTANVQGRIDNGVADACYATATVATDRFLQLEQSAQLRGTGLSSQSVTRALSDVVPCSLPGAGLGCAAAPTAIVCR